MRPIALLLLTSCLGGAAADVTQAATPAECGCEALADRLTEVEAQAPAMRMQSAEGVTGEFWCHLVDLEPGEVLVSAAWFDYDGTWRTESPGSWPFAQDGQSVGYQNNSGCEVYVYGYRVISAHL